MVIQRIRFYIFLRDVLLLALISFGGPHAHLAHFQNILVRKRRYLSNEDLMELYALGQMLPGPTSTQTLTAIGFRLGGPSLAYLTLLVWIFPAVCIMIFAGILMSNFHDRNISLDFTRFVLPIAVGFVAYAAYSISIKTVTTRTGIVLMVASAVLSYFINSPFLLPVIMLLAGSVTALKYKSHPVEKRQKFTVVWANFILWASVLVIGGVLATLVKGIPEALPIRLFENFYRNGSLIFGGGQVLIPLMFVEFVQYLPKQYLTAQEFLSGYAIAQSIPGPVFSFSAYIGALAMRDFGFGGEIIGGFMAAIGIFLPGTFLIFFVIRIWDGLKKYRPIRASLEGINAASAGLVAAAAILLYQPLDDSLINFMFIAGAFSLMAFTKMPSWLIIIIGLALGFVL